MVDFEIDQCTVCMYILNAHFSSNLCLQALYETSWEANLVITMCWEQARFSCWWQHQPRLVATIKILCWLCGNHWLCRNCWFRLCRNLRVGAAGPPKYSTPWLLWTPINFSFDYSWFLAKILLFRTHIACYPKSKYSLMHTLCWV